MASYSDQIRSFKWVIRRILELRLTLLIYFHRKKPKTTNTFILVRHINLLSPASLMRTQPSTKYIFIFTIFFDYPLRFLSFCSHWVHTFLSGTTSVSVRVCALSLECPFRMNQWAMPKRINPIMYVWQERSDDKVTYDAQLRTEHITLSLLFHSLVNLNISKNWKGLPCIRIRYFVCETQTYISHVCKKAQIE